MANPALYAIASDDQSEFAETEEALQVHTRASRACPQSSAIWTKFLLYRVSDEFPIRAPETDDGRNVKRPRLKSSPKSTRPRWGLASWRKPMVRWIHWSKSSSTELRTKAELSQLRLLKVGDRVWQSLTVQENIIR